jgi:hypothetical protein
MTTYKHTYSTIKSVPQAYQQQLGIAASEFKVEIPGVSRSEAKRAAKKAARKRCQDELQRAFNADSPVLIEALMGLGKSHGGVKLAKLLNRQVTVHCGRGHEGQYNQYQKCCDRYKLSHYRLPSFFNDCETARGDYNEKAQRQVTNWHEQGVQPSDIHEYGNLPCTDTGTCEYQQQANFDPDSYDVLLGHYTHAHNPRYTTSRIGIFDEFPGEDFITEFSSPQQIISDFLSQTDLPFSTFSGLLQNRNNISWIKRERFGERHDISNRSPAEIINSKNSNQHTLTPFLIYTLLQMTDLGNGWEYTQIQNRKVVHNKSDNHIHVLHSPKLDYATQVIGLDGTPSHRQWRLALGYSDRGDKRLDHRRVLTDAERQQYIRNVLDLNIIQTTDNIYPYSSGHYVNVERDRVYLKTINDQYGAEPVLFTSQSAESQYRQSNVMNHIESSEHFGNVRGDNQYKNTRLAAIVGSPHRGDEWVKKWSALSGKPTTRKGKGKQLTYTNGGDEFLSQMREQEVLQTIMRVGRDSKGAIIYVHTGAIPEWTPIAHGPKSCYILNWTDTQQNIIQAVADIEDDTTADIVSHPAITCSSQYVTKQLHKMEEYDYISKEDTGSEYKWSDTGVSAIKTPIEVRFTHPCYTLPH